VAEQGTDDFQDFVKDRSGSLLRFAFWMTGNWDDAEEAVQESLARAFIAWPRIEQPEAYLHRMVINTVRSAYRVRRREILVAEPPAMGGVNAEIEALAVRHLLVAALRRLPRRQRAIVVLRYCLDLPGTDVARLLGCSTGTVKSQASKGLAKMRMDPALRADHRTPAQPAEGDLA
jgi:RNA polymerase sigma-70 factor (sigma-E family)